MCLVQVTAMSLQVKTNCVKSVNPASQGITAEHLPKLFVEPEGADSSEESELQLSDRQPLCRETNFERKTKSDTKAINRTLMIGQQQPGDASKKQCALSGDATGKGSAWTQQQQRLLEEALTTYPKGTPERWDRISEMIPDKTKVGHRIDFAAHYFQRK